MIAVLRFWKKFVHRDGSYDAGGVQGRYVYSTWPAVGIQKLMKMKMEMMKMRRRMMEMEMMKMRRTEEDGNGKGSSWSYCCLRSGHDLCNFWFCVPVVLDNVLNIINVKVCVTG